MSHHLLTVTEVAAYLGVPPSRIYDRWRAWGLPGIKIGQSLRFRLAEIDDWLEQQKAACQERITCR